MTTQLEKYWGEVLKRRKGQSEGGKKGAKVKRDKALNTQGTPEGQPIGTPEGQPIGTPEGQPIGTPEGSYSTVQFNSIQSNKVQSMKALPYTDRMNFDRKWAAMDALISSSVELKYQLSKIDVPVVKEAE